MGKETHLKLKLNFENKVKNIKHSCLRIVLIKVVCAIQNKNYIMRAYVVNYK